MARVPLGQPGVTRMSLRQLPVNMPSAVMDCSGMRGGAKGAASVVRDEGRVRPRRLFIFLECVSRTTREAPLTLICAAQYVLSCGQKRLIRDVSRDQT